MKMFLHEAHVVGFFVVVFFIKTWNCLFLLDHMSIYFNPVLLIILTEGSTPPGHRIFQRKSLHELFSCRRLSEESQRSSQS